jgi:hypothetical protein
MIAFAMQSHLRTRNFEPAGFTLESSEATAIIMTKKIISFVLVLVPLLVSPAQAAKPVESLHDLPQRWHGVAGGFASKTNAAFVISKVTKVSREERPNGLWSALYDVESTIQAGARTISVRQIRLNNVIISKNVYEMTLICNDELTLAITASVIYDEATNQFTLKDFPVSGERRFSFTGQALP